MTKRQKEIFGLILIVFSFLSLVSLFGHDVTEHPKGLYEGYKPNNYLGFFGIYVSYYHYLLLGYSSIIFPVIFSILGYIFFSGKFFKPSVKLIFYILIVGLLFSVFMSFFAYISNNLSLNNHFSGIIGYTIFIFLKDFLGIIGVSFFLFISLLLIITNIYKISIYDLFNNLYHFLILSASNLIRFFKNIFQFSAQIIKKKNNDEIPINQNESVDNISMEDQKDEINEYDMLLCSAIYKRED